MRSVNRIATTWRKSSYSAACGDCVEVGHLANGHIGVGDTKDASEAALGFTSIQWQTFVAEIKRSRLGPGLDLAASVRGRRGRGLPDAGYGFGLRRMRGPRRSRCCQHAVCQCLRSFTPMPPAIRAPSAGHATTCGVPGTISWSHPGSGTPSPIPRPGSGGQPSPRPAMTRRARARARGRAGRSARGGCGAGSRLSRLLRPTQ